jgi:spermidine/putrescine transport system ATP-binding protein
VTDTPDIRLRNVTKRFGTTTVIDNLDLDIDRGHFYALLGPSGCGKTTTLRMIGGFELPTEGTVMLGDADVTHLPPHKRDVNTVFQSYALFPHLTVEKNIAFGLERKKVSKADVKRRVEEVLETVQLGHLAKRKPTQLSGGQAQRVALARALVNRPRALLLDEPLGALDLRLRRQLQIELKRIQQDVGITFIHVTHDQEEAMSMADTIAVMNAGQIEQAGGAEELYETPRTAFVANFLGTSNLIDAKVDGAGVTTHDGASLRVSQDRLAGRTGAVRVGVRPEKIIIGNGDHNGHNVLRGKVVVASFLGVNVQYVVQAEGGEELTVICQNDGGLTHGPGQDVDLAWDPVHTFVVESDGEAGGGDERSEAGS